MMPLLDGAGVIKAMREKESLRAIPVILASALPEKTISERCSGYQVFLRKPFKAERLMEEIRGCSPSRQAMLERGLRRYRVIPLI